MSDEQRVRTTAGWIGVELSRSRVRTPGKAGYGLYRVRGTSKALGRGRHDYPGEWTAYAFVLEEIEAGVRRAIETGMPGGPGRLMLMPSRGSDPALARGYEVPVRWVSAYRGRRDLGGRTDLGAPPVGAGLPAQSVRARQRASNQAFQIEHKRRRDWGLKRRHATKLSRVQPPVQGEDGAAPKA